MSPNARTRQGIRSRARVGHRISGWAVLIVLAAAGLRLPTLGAQTSVVTTRPPQQGAAPTAQPAKGAATPLPTGALAGAQRATRAELTARLEQVERSLAAGGVAGDARLRAMAEVAALRQRLTDGDFRTGDRFLVWVRSETMKADTATVRDSLRVALLNLPDLSLQGVLRAELDDRVSAHVARYLRTVTVRTNPLTRIAILGAVRMPGFYYVLPERPMSDLVMIAGGPAPEADLDKLELRRGSTWIVRAKEMRRLLKDGRTLEQVDVQSGDEAFLGIKRKTNWQVVVQLFFVISSIVFTAVQFLQWYYNRQNLY